MHYVTDTDKQRLYGAKEVRMNLCFSISAYVHTSHCIAVIKKGRATHVAVIWRGVLHNYALAQIRVKCILHASIKN